MASKKKAPGRPSKYTPDCVQKGYDYAVLGLTDEELAQVLGIATSTLYEWKLKYPEFSESLKAGKIPADAEISSALYGRARGSEWDEEQAIKCKTVEYNEQGKRISEKERVEIVTVHRVAPPDTTAIIFWLKNRRPAEWRDRVEQHHSGHVKVTKVTEQFVMPDGIEDTDAVRIPTTH